MSRPQQAFPPIRDQRGEPHVRRFDEQRFDGAAAFDPKIHSLTPMTSDDFCKRFCKCDGAILAKSDGPE